MTKPSIFKLKHVAMLLHRITSKPIVQHLSPVSGSSISPFRNYWREVIRVTPDPRRPGKQTYEDPEMAAHRSARAQSSEGK